MPPNSRHLFESPYLRTRGVELRECPVGLNLRESPWVFEVIETASMTDNCTPRDWYTLPAFYRKAVRVVRGERERIREAKRAAREAQGGERRRRG